MTCVGGLVRCSSLMLLTHAVIALFCVGVACVPCVRVLVNAQVAFVVRRPSSVGIHERGTLVGLSAQSMLLTIIGLRFVCFAVARSCRHHIVARARRHACSGACARAEHCRPN